MRKEYHSHSFLTLKHITTHFRQRSMFANSTNFAYQNTCTALPRGSHHEGKYTAVPHYLTYSCFPAPKTSRSKNVCFNALRSPDAALSEDTFQIFYKVSNHDCYRVSETPLLRDHIGLFTYSLGDFSGDGNDVELAQEQLDIINDIDVNEKHVSLLNIGLGSYHCSNNGWIKVIDAFRNGGAQSVSYQFRERSITA